MSKARGVARKALSVIAIGCVAWFFYRAFRANWAQLLAADFTPAYSFLGLAAVSMLTALLLGTLGWQVAINAAALAHQAEDRANQQRQLSFSESIAAVNTSSLTKYVPGKVWSYALQMHWLSGAGVGKGLVLYANLANLAISLATSTLVGLLCLTLASHDSDQRTLLAAVFGVSGIAYSFVVVFHSRPLPRLAALMSRLFKRRFEYFAYSGETLLRLNLVHFAAAFLSGLSTYLMCEGIGHSVAPGDAMTIVASSLIGDVVGFLAIIVPGGLGVREGVMWWLMKSAAPPPIALVLPIISRFLSMLIEVFLGVVALVLLRRLTRRLRAESESDLRTSS